MLMPTSPLCIYTLFIPCNKGRKNYYIKQITVGRVFITKGTKGLPPRLITKRQKGSTTILKKGQKVTFGCDKSFLSNSFCSQYSFS